MPRSLHPALDRHAPPGGGHTPPGHLGGDGGGAPAPRGRPGGDPRLRRYRIGLAFAVLSIAMLFTALTSAYVYRQGSSRYDEITRSYVSDWRPMVIPQILWLNTFLLLLSSVTVEFSRRQIFREPAATEEWLGLGAPARRAALPWMGISLILGIAFLIGQSLAWRQLWLQGAFASTDPGSAFFYLLTGTHAVHLFGGICAFLWSLLAGLLHRPLRSRQIALDIAAWYWHAMGLLWLYLFALMLVLR
jgi:cytochrome c oxidase subunit 3